MKKIRLKRRIGPPFCLKKFILVLKFITILLFIPGLCISLEANSQSAHFSFNLQNITIEQLFDKIENESEYSFFYKDNEINIKERVSVNAENKGIDEILSQAFSGKGISYVVNGNHIILQASKREAAKAIDSKVADPQKDLITGNVLDKDGVPLIGVTVSVKGSNNATITDIDGFFSITTEQGQTLSFSYIGFQRREVVVADKKQLVVVLYEDLKALDEVVVVGYGVQRKITLTGSVATIKTKEIKQSAVSNLSNALVGRLPGLLARQSKGEVGGDGSTIRLRGAATYGSNKDPLVMIDGVARSGFEFIDPNEVESITILKDASATAIYGVRGANGVILVTTKRGEAASKPKVTVNVEQAFLTPMKMLSYLNAPDYFRVYRRGLINDGQIQAAQTYTDEFISQYDRSANNPWDYKYLYPDTDWTEELLKDWSYRTTANANITGGTDRARYFVSGSFLTESGIYNRTNEAKGYDPQARESRINFRSNVDIKLSSWLNTDVSLATIIRKRNYPATTGDAMFAAIRRTPSYDYAIMNPDGSIGAGQSGDANPYGRLVHSGYKKINNSYLQTTIGLNANLDFILKGLSAKVRFSYDARNDGGYTRSKSFSTYKYNADGTYTLRTQGDDFLSYATSSDYWDMTLSPEVYLMYNQKFAKDHDISAMAVYRSSSTMKRSTNDDKSTAAIGALPFREQGIVGRITYGYKDKYFGEFNFGYNGSENFVKGKRFGFFPSGSIAWVMNKENFMSGTTSWLEMLKIRASVGQVGNSATDTRFAYQSRWSFDTGSYTFGDQNQNKLITAGELAVGNNNVTWETATKYDAGIDLMIKKGLLSFTGDIFYEHRTGVFDNTQAITSALMGYVVFPRENVGIVDNKGFEFEIAHVNHIGKDITYELKASYTYTKNKIKKCMEAPQPTRPWLERTGKSIYEIKTYQTAGLFQNWEEIADAASQSQFTANLQPGDIRYVDLDGDMIITSYDQAYIGKNSEANQILGFSGQFRYKGFDIAALFQGAFGRYLFINGYSLFGNNYEMRQIFSDFDNNYWTPENSDAKYPRPMAQKNTNNTQQSTFWMKKGDYIRLKNVEIGYTIPRNISRKWAMEQLRIYANGNNLITWDKLDGLFDPEEDNGSPKYPLMRTFNVGLSITF